MSTTIRAELSEKNPYWIEKHRYYELKHFCLQYPIWKRAYESIDGLAKRPLDVIIFSNGTGDPTVRAAEAMLFYSERMEMLEKIARETDPELGNYIFKGIINGVSFDLLNSQINVPCCKDRYYELYRRYFWLLNKARK